MTAGQWVSLACSQRAVIARIAALEQEGDAVLEHEGPDRAGGMIQQLATRRGIGVQSATVLVCEALVREFANGLQAASRPVHTWMAASQALLAMPGFAPGFAIDPLTAGAVVLATAATEAVYVMFTSAVVARRGVLAASWSSLWYLLSSYAVISYTENWLYVCFAAIGSWPGAFASITFLHNTPARPPAGSALE